MAESTPKVEAPAAPAKKPDAAQDVVRVRVADFMTHELVYHVTEKDAETGDDVEVRKTLTQEPTEMSTADFEVAQAAAQDAQVSLAVEVDTEEGSK